MHRFPQRLQANYVAGAKSDEEVVEMMIGCEFSHAFPAKPPPPR
jgi:hypothetical protein